MGWEVSALFCEFPKCSRMPVSTEEALTSRWHLYVSLNSQFWESELSHLSPASNPCGLPRPSHQVTQSTSKTSDGRWDQTWVTLVGQRSVYCTFIFFFLMQKIHSHQSTVLFTLNECLGYLFPVGDRSSHITQHCKLIVWDVIICQYHTLLLSRSTNQG